MVPPPPFYQTISQSILIPDKFIVRIRECLRLLEAGLMRLPVIVLDEDLQAFAFLLSS